MLLLITGLIIIPQLSIKISVKTTGILRPINERTEIKSISSGLIKNIFVKDGSKIKKGDKIIELSIQNIKQKSNFLSIGLNRNQELINDLEIVIKYFYSNLNLLDTLKSSLYRAQYQRFLNQTTLNEIALSKLYLEWKIDSSLYLDKVISKKELYDRKIAFDQQSNNNDLIKKEQFIVWQRELKEYLQNNELVKSNIVQANFDIEQNTIYAPIDGVVQISNVKYIGNAILTGETICSISPQTTLIAECHTNSSDIGMLKIGQNANIQIDAFNYNYFGSIKAIIHEIDNDFSIINNKPVFKIKCTFKEKRLKLKNGFVGELKNGLTFRVNFIITERTIGQLLFDSVNDWLKPSINQHS